MDNDKQRLRSLPSVDRVLRETPHLAERWGHERVTAAIRNELERMRNNPEALNPAGKTSLVSHVAAAVDTELENAAKSSLVRVFNLTGTVLHTNLGRALLPEEALEAVQAVASSPSSLEYDLQTGKRGDRDEHVEYLICELCAVEAATVVNNNAAAVLLVLNTLAKELEVPVSRGELVEIGGSFRIPEIMQSSGCVLVEVGTTNRTHLKDYKNAVNDKTALLLKVHASNYQIQGFTRSVAETDLAELAHQHGLPFIVDLGSGNLVDFPAFKLPDEPTVMHTVKSGADIVTFSGDKLLGGPQCGIVAGKRELITRIKRNPMKRALRVDKMTLAALVEVLRLYQDPSRLVEKLPTLAALARPAGKIRAQAERVAPHLAEALAPHYQVAVTECRSQVGSGALPVETLPSFGIRISAVDDSDEAIRQLADAMRGLPAPVIGRINKGAYFLDLRCLDREEEFIAQLDKSGLERSGNFA
ncbi:MAG: L-seryl-tRNA(Sec) selenium transferase [Gammaproteobacteria bacterium]|nr:L-seryl-tRNA(Sec) selenium transferase [Gammaproteobacteria bacterium]